MWYMVTATSVNEHGKPGIGPSWISRAQAIDMLDCSMMTLLRLERQGLLRPVRGKGENGGQNKIFYDVDELTSISRRRRKQNAYAPGECQARAFEMFSEGKTNNEVVLETRELAHTIKAWREDWLDGGAADIVIGPRARAELVAAVGEWQSIAELIARVKKLAKSVKRAAANEEHAP
jgi:hypothetical protein